MVIFFTSFVQYAILTYGILGSKRLTKERHVPENMLVTLLKCTTNHVEQLRSSRKCVESMEWLGKTI